MASVGSDEGHYSSSEGDSGQQYIGYTGAEVGPKRVKLISKATDFQLRNFGSVEEVWSRFCDDKLGKITEEEFRTLCLEILLFESMDLAEEVDILIAIVKSSMPDSEPSFSLKDAEKVLQMRFMTVELRTVCTEYIHTNGERKESILRLLQHINGDKIAIWHREADWVLDLAAIGRRAVHGAGPDDFAIIAAVSFWALTSVPPDGILKDKLMERLALEIRFAFGCVSFTAFILLFGVTVIALNSTSKTGPCRGIRSNLINLFDLDSLDDHTSSWRSVHGWSQQFSSASTMLAPLSNRYFSAGAEITLLGEPVTFSEPVRLQELDLWLGRAFTLQAWVAAEPDDPQPPGGLPIFRRALAGLGEGSTLSCLSWNFPPSLAFGAHDYGPAQANNFTGRMEEFIRVNYSHHYREYEQPIMHTLVVDGTEARFYIDNGTLIGKVDMPRLITDCADGVSSLGVKGLTLSGVVYRPGVTTAGEINEVFRQGTLLGDLGFSIGRRSAGTIDSVQRLIEASEKSGRDSAERLEGTSLLVMSSTQLVAQAVISSPSAEEETSASSLSINSTSVDPVLGYPVVRIIDAPVLFGDSEIVTLNGDMLPRLEANKGFALSTWLKFDPEHSGFLFARAIPSWTGSEFQWRGREDMCWWIYVGAGDTEFKFRTSDDGREYGVLINDMAAPKDEQFSMTAYRHLLFQVDPTKTNEPMMVCIDGKCTYSESGSGVSLADCESVGHLDERYGTAEMKADALNASRFWVGQRPPGVWHYTGYAMNVKMFDRTLTEDEVLRLFSEDKDAEGRPIQQNQGCKFREDLRDDSRYEDELGHDCAWYFESNEQGLDNCKRNPTALARCPIACRAEVCWRPLEVRDKESFTIWEQQVEFRSKGSWGTTCVAKSTTAAKEAIKCGLGATNDIAGCGQLGIAQCAPVDCSEFEDDEASLLECLGDVVWVSSHSERIENQFMPCVEIIRTHEPTCDWDDTELNDVAASIAESNEWSLRFWFQPLRSTECVHPQLRLINGDGFAFSVLSGFKEIELDPPGGIGCLTKPWLSHTVNGKRSAGFPHVSEADIRILPEQRPKPEDKHLVVIGTTGDRVGIQYDTRGDWDNLNQNGGLPAFKRDKDFLRVINVLGNIRLSPMVLESQYPSSGEVAQVWYRELEPQRLKRGASPTAQEQATSRLARTSTKFAEPTMLVAPPMIIQTRKSASECAWSFSDAVIDAFHQQGQATQCDYPYLCDAGYTRSSVFQCSDGLDEDNSYFGIAPREFQGQKVFVEFLSTITDFPIVVREKGTSSEANKKEAMETDTFLDSMTQDVQVVGLFFSPSDAITTKLTVFFEAVDGTIKGSFRVQHFVVLAGKDLDVLIWFEVFIGVLQALMLARILWKVIIDRRRIGLALMKKLDDVHLLPLDVVVQLASLIFFIAMKIHTTSSGDRTVQHIGALMDLEWDSKDIDFNTKQSSFLDILEQVTWEIDKSDVLGIFGMLVAMSIFVRVVMAISMHPRLAIISSTLRRALADALHFFIVFSIVMTGFAMLGSWRFGDEREDMKSVGEAMKTQFDAVLGPPGNLEVSAHFGSDLDTGIYIVYALMIHVINLFFLMNFFLAIIVNAFSANAEALSESDVARDFFADLFFQCRHLILSLRYRWNTRSKIYMQIAVTRDKYITPEVLLNVGFSTHESAKAFLDQYSGFNFVPQDHTYSMAAMHNDSVMFNSTMQRLLHQTKTGGSPITSPRGGRGDASGTGGGTSSAPAVLDRKLHTEEDGSTGRAKLKAECVILNLGDHDGAPSEAKALPREDVAPLHASPRGGRHDGSATDASLLKHIHEQVETGVDRAFERHGAAEEKWSQQAALEKEVAALRKELREAQREAAEERQRQASAMAATTELLRAMQASQSEIQASLRSRNGPREVASESSVERRIPEDEVGRELGAPSSLDRSTPGGTNGAGSSQASRPLSFAARSRSQTPKPLPKLRPAKD